MMAAFHSGQVRNSILVLNYLVNRRSADTTSALRTHADYSSADHACRFRQNVSGMIQLKGTSNVANRRGAGDPGALTVRDAVDTKVEAWAKALPELERSTFEAAIRLQRAVLLGGQVSIDQLVAPLALHPGDADVIANLFEQGSPYTLTPGRLTELCFVTSGATTGRLTRLERAGLVKRSASRADRRSVNISLTRKGVRVVVNLTRSLQRARFTVALAGLGKRDVSALNRILRALELALVVDQPETREPHSEHAAT